jgi:hypothetical protein
VPYHEGTLPGGTIPSLTYQILEGELTRVESVATVALPVSDFLPELQSDLWDFTFADGQELVGHIVNVRQLLDTATVDIQAALGGTYGTSAMKGRIDRWFKGNAANEPDPTQQQAGEILDVYLGVASNLDTDTITYRNKGSALGYQDLYGWNSGWNDGNEIHMGAHYFSGGAGDRFGTVIHELVHTQTGDEDYAYFDNPESLTGPDVVWNVNPLIGLTVTTAELIENPDSYAGLLTQYYYL